MKTLTDMNDGWGMTPSQTKNWERIMSDQRTKKEEAKSNAKFWLTTYKHVQGKISINKRFAGTQEQAMKRAINHFGKPDGCNTFITLKPVG